MKTEKIVCDMCGDDILLDQQEGKVGRSYAKGAVKIHIQSYAALNDPVANVRETLRKSLYGIDEASQYDLCETCLIRLRRLIKLSYDLRTDPIMKKYIS